MVQFTTILSCHSLGDGEMSEGEDPRTSTGLDRDAAACKAKNRTSQLGRRYACGDRGADMGIYMNNPHRSLVWSQLVDALSSDSPFATDTRSRLGSKLPKWVYRALCAVLPSQAKHSLSGSTQRAAFLFMPLTWYLGQVLDFKWPSSVYLEEKEMKYLKLSGKYMSSTSAQAALRIRCNNEWCIASAMATVHQREIIDRLWDLVRGLDDSVKQESSRKLNLIKKLRDAIRYLDTQKRQQEDARKTDRKLIQAFNLRCRGLVSVRQELEKTVSLQQDRLKWGNYTLNAWRLALDEREGQSAEALAGMREATATLAKSVDTKKELETLQEQNRQRERQEKIVTADRRLNTATQKARDLERENATLREGLVGMSIEKESLQEENATLKKEVEEMNTENELLQEENTTLGEKVEGMNTENGLLQEENDRLKEHQEKEREKGPTISTTKGKAKKQTGKAHDTAKAAIPINASADAAKDTTHTNETPPDKVPGPATTTTPSVVPDFPALPGARPGPFDVQATQLLHRIKARTQKMIIDLDNTKAVRFGEAWGVVNAMEQATRRAENDIDKEIAGLFAARNLERS